MANYTQSQIDSLRAAIASGVLIVRHGDVSTQYRSLAEMQAVLKTMTDDVGGAPVRRSRAVFESGTSRGGVAYRRGWSRG